MAGAATRDALGTGPGQVAADDRGLARRATKGAIARAGPGNAQATASEPQRTGREDSLDNGLRWSVAAKDQVPGVLFWFGGAAK